MISDLEPAGVPPLLGGCVAVFLVSWLIKKSALMTGKPERRGVHVPNDYVADNLD